MQKRKISPAFYSILLYLQPKIRRGSSARLSIPMHIGKVGSSSLHKKLKLEKFRRGSSAG